MRLFAGDLEVATAREIAINSLFADDLCDQINRSARGRVHASHCFHAIALPKCAWVELEAGQHHPAIAGTSSPTNRVGFENGHAGAALCQSTCGGKASESRADD